MMRLGAILKKARGKESRVQFARKLELSYTFVRAMEHGLRFPSDKVLLDIADRLGESSEELLLAAYCDRSPLLAEVLKTRGIAVPPGGDEAVDIQDEETGEILQPQAQAQPAAPAPQAIRAHDPF
jgi:transcriptional regulator with XRE-family HTH domain